MDLELHGRVAIVTGGARGIGRAHCERLAGEGASVVLVDLDGDAGEATAESLRRGGLRCEAVAADATDEVQVDAVVAGVVERHRRLDVLVNNAGIGVGAAPRVEAMSLAEWDGMFRAHGSSTFLWSRAVIGPMRRNGFGRIVNTSSMNFTGGGRPGVAHYAAAKAAVAGFTRTLAKEVGGDGITVNAIAPGYVATELIGGFSDDMLERLRTQNPLNRLCRPEEVAALAAYLCSTMAAFINGELICIDGGRRDFVWTDSGEGA